jgi:beta-carotene 15,15'-dioxygenase
VRWVFPVAAGPVAALGALGWSPSTTVTLAVVVVAVIVGMPHGAYDVVAGPRLFGWVRFGALYGLLGAAVVGVWIAAPFAALIAFLVVSAWHFGIGDAIDWPVPRRWQVTRALATGGLVIGGPLAMHWVDAASTFDVLLLDRATVPADDLRHAGIAMLAAALWCALVSIRRHVARGETAGALELGALAALMTLAPPLPAFAIYFAFGHSVRHLATVRASARDVAPTVIAAGATVIAAAVAWWMLQPSAESSVRVIFIGLAALTAPHLVVTTALQQRLLTHVGRLGSAVQVTHSAPSSTPRS